MDGSNNNGKDNNNDIITYNCKIENDNDFLSLVSNDNDLVNKNCAIYKSNTYYYKLDKKYALQYYENINDVRYKILRTIGNPKILMLLDLQIDYIIFQWIIHFF